MSSNGCIVSYFPSLLVVLLFLMSSPSLEAQPVEPDTLRAHNLFQKADSLQYHARLDSSSYLFKQASTLFRQAAFWNRALDAQINLADNHTQSGNYEEAEKVAQQGLNLVDDHLAEPLSNYYQARLQQLLGWLDLEQSRYKAAMDHFAKAQDLLPPEGDEYAQLRSTLLFRIGEVHGAQGGYEQAMENYFKALDRFNRYSVLEPRFVSEVYNSIGIVHQQRGENERAMEYYRRSLQIDRQALGENHPDIASGLNNIAIIYYYQGDYQRALDYMKQATNTLSSFWGENHPKVAIGYNNISIVHSEMGELRKAIEYMERSIGIKKKVIGEVNADVAIGYQNLGALYYDLDEYDQAIENYRRALELHQQIFDGAHPEIANIYSNMGEAYSEMKDYEKALSYLQKDLQMNQKLLGGSHPFLADTHTKIGNIFFAQQKHLSALTNYNRAINILTGVSIQEAGIASIPLENITHPIFLMEALEEKAKVHRKIYEESVQVDQLHKALDTYLKASSLIRNLQMQYRSDESKLQLGEKANSIYQAGVETAYDLYRETGDRDQIEYLLYFMEHNKARVLVDNLKESDARYFSGIPDTLLNKEHELRKNISGLHQAIRQKTDQAGHIDSVDTSHLQDSLFIMKQSLTAHINHLEANYPKYYRLKFQDIKLSTSTIRNEILQPGETFIEYAVSEENVIAIVINDKKTTVHRTRIDSSLVQDVRDFRTVIEDKNPTQFKELSQKIYQRVFEPVRQSVSGNDLTIVPDGILNYLPFEALVSPSSANEEASSFRDFKYLIEDYVINYAPSARFLKMQNSRLSPSSQRNALALAPVFSSLGTTSGTNNESRTAADITTLPLSRYEVQQIDSLVKSHGLTSQTLLNKAATEMKFKQQPLHQYDIVHLATHAFFFEDSTLQSGIYFAPNSQGAEDDVLLLAEIYNLSLQAKLVVLSACETALGTLKSGEGLMSLARAFQYAGAQQLMVSLWKVDDRSTSQLMIRFYQYWLDGATIPQAARQAKLDLMEYPRYNSPLFWAPFVIIG
ncbi:MAG: CHAT domain-containing protein [Balneolaceae bacterium]|nr:CHAT domain-containing protein [Balneolaceae bacterium]